MLEWECKEGVSRRQVVMAAADGVSKLLKLLADKHEAVRNEALLLLAGLSHSHPGIRQKASAGGAFGQVLSIIRCSSWIVPV